MVGLTILEVYNSFFFHITKEKNNFKLYTGTFDEFLFEEKGVEVEEILHISNISSEHLPDEIIGPRIISTYGKLQLEKTMTDGYYMLLLGYARSPFRDFESHRRIVTGLDEDDFWLILRQYNSNFVTYDLSPGIYTIKDISEAIYTMCDHEGTLKIEYENDTMKTKLILKRFGRTFGTLRFDKISFFYTLLGFEPIWNYKPTNAIHRPGVYSSDKILKLNIINKIQLKCDVFVGSFVKGIREPIIYIFVSERPPGYIIFCEP